MQTKFETNAAPSRRALCLALCIWSTTHGALGAQPDGRKRRIAFLSGTLLDPATKRTQVDPFIAGLRELGHVEGQNISIDFRWAEGRPERLPALLAELLALQPDVLVASGPRPAQLARDGAGSVPVVALAVNDPIQSGFAVSLARPGGTMTGVSSWGEELVAKRLQLLKELVPTVRRVGVLNNPATVSTSALAADLAAFEQRLGMSIKLYDASHMAQFEAVFEAMAVDRIAALLVLADATFWVGRQRLGELIMKYRLPSIWGGRDYLEQGWGIASYQSDWASVYRRGAALVDSILGGANPGVVPFERASKLDLVLNLKAARALGITVPRALLVSADELIE